LNEKWVQELTASDPSILGLGELVLGDKERIQPRAGRLDLLLQDQETKRRYEVEIQLGSTDEAHIIAPKSKQKLASPGECGLAVC
jgi:hypothetical protein